MNIYKSKLGLLPGTDYQEVLRKTRSEYKTIQARTKRQPYVRSKYFGKDKVFINIFFNHLVQKRKGEQIKRAKFFLCAIDLLRNSGGAPVTIFSKQNMNRPLSRPPLNYNQFSGQSADFITKKVALATILPQKSPAHS